MTCSWSKCVFAILLLFGILSLNFKFVRLIQISYDDDIDDDIDIEIIDGPQQQYNSNEVLSDSNSDLSDDTTVKMRNMHKNATNISWKAFNLYQFELAALGLCVVLFVTYFVGSKINTVIVQSWIKQNKPLFKSYFEYCGDTNLKTQSLIQLNDQKLILWCTGNKFCKGVLLELDLFPRQSLIEVFVALLTRRQLNDKLRLTTYLNSEDIEFPIMVMGDKQIVRDDPILKAHGQFCKQRSIEVLFEKTKNVPANIMVASELNEFYSEMSKKSLGQLFKQFHSIIGSFLLTDVKYDEEEKEFNMAEGEPESADVDNVLKSKILVADLKFGGGFFKSTLCPNINFSDFFNVWIKLIEEISTNSCPIEKGGKIKLAKARVDILSKVQKKQHQMRVEKAMQRKDMKVREENEKIMAAANPTLQMKLQAKKEKREQRNTKKKYSKAIKIAP